MNIKLEYVEGKCGTGYAENAVGVRFYTNMEFLDINKLYRLSVGKDVILDNAVEGEPMEEYRIEDILMELKVDIDNNFFVKLDYTFKNIETGGLYHQMVHDYDLYALMLASIYEDCNPISKSDYYIISHNAKKISSEFIKAFEFSMSKTME